MLEMIERIDRLQGLDSGLSREALRVKTLEINMEFQKDLREGLVNHYQNQILELVEAAFAHGFNSAVKTMCEEKEPKDGN